MPATIWWQAGRTDDLSEDQIEWNKLSAEIAILDRQLVEAGILPRKRRWWESGHHDHIVALSAPGYEPSILRTSSGEYYEYFQGEGPDRRRTDYYEAVPTSILDMPDDPGRRRDALKFMSLIKSALNERLRTLK